MIFWSDWECCAIVTILFWFTPIRRIFPYLKRWNSEISNSKLLEMSEKIPFDLKRKCSLILQHEQIQNRMMIANEIKSKGSYWIACNFIWYLKCLKHMWDYNVIALCKRYQIANFERHDCMPQHKINQQKYAQAAHINHIPFSKYLRKIEWSIRYYCCMLFSLLESANERAFTNTHIIIHAWQKKSNLII